MELSFSFWINLGPTKGAEVTDLIPVLIHKTGAANGDFGAFTTVPVHFRPGWRGPPPGRERTSSSKPVLLFSCVHCQQRHQLVHSLSIWSKWKQRQQNKGRDVFAPGILFWHLFWILARPTIVCIILRKKTQKQQSHYHWIWWWGKWAGKILDLRCALFWNYKE